MTIGSEVTNTVGLKIVCCNKVTIGNRVLFGWDIMLCDNNFHLLKNLMTNQKIPNDNGGIIIGDDCWIASECRLLSNARIPKKPTIGFRSLIHSPVDIDEGCVIGSENKIKILATNCYLDFYDNR